ncbi:MAG: DUF1800 domain-containing protein, partial [Dermatophilaceae bacterium]
VQRLEPLAKGATQAQRQARNQQQRAQTEAVLGWWVRRMVAAKNPLVEKLTFGWHQHFATSAARVRDAGAMLTQNERLRALGRGRFPDLAVAMLTDPAMLVWLDGVKNRTGAPNENLAREYLELFTLGHDGGYSESDVKEGARALTGWTVDGGTARLVPRRHDSEPKTVLGVTGNLDAAGFADAVLRHPAVAAHVATRWWRQLASPDAPPAQTLSRLVTAYGTQGELGPMFRALFTDPAFDAADGTLVASPVEWVIGAARALRLPADEATATTLSGMLRSLGQVPLYPPNVAGWPSGQAWLSTSAAQARARFAARLVAAGDLSSVEVAATASRVEAVTHLLGIPRLSARSAAALRPLAGNPRRLATVALLSPEYLVS